MEDSKVFDIRGIASSLKRLQIFIILTSEYGKPSDKYIESLIHNFYDDIHDNTIKRDLIKPNFDTHFKDNPNYIQSGGFNFYSRLSKLNGKTKEEIRYFIESYDPEDITEVTEEPVSMAPVVEHETEIIDKNKEEIENKPIIDENNTPDDDIIIKEKLRDSIDIKVKDSDGKFTGIIQFDSKSKEFIIKAGSKTCAFPKSGDALVEKYVNDALELSRLGYSNTRFEYIKDFRCKKLNEALGLLTFSNELESRLFVEVQDGDTTESESLLNILNSTWNYIAFIKNNKNTI